MIFFFFSFWPRGSSNKFLVFAPEVDRWSSRDFITCDSMIYTITWYNVISVGWSDNHFSNLRLNKSQNDNDVSADICVCVYISIYVYMYVCMYACMYVRVHIYIYIYIYIHTMFQLHMWYHRRSDGSLGSSGRPPSFYLFVEGMYL